MNLIPTAILLTAGIYSASYINIFSAVSTVLIFAVICVVRMLITHKNTTTKSCDFKKSMLEGILAAFVFLFGIFLYHSAMRIDIAHIGDYVTLRGVVAELPYESSGINKYVVYCKDLEFNGEVTHPKKKILINADEEFNCGDSVSVRGKLIEFSDDENSYGFDTKRSYAGKGIKAKMTALEMESSEVKYHYFSVSYLANILCSKAAAQIRRYYDGDIAAAMIAITTGDKHLFSDTYNDVLTRTSMHHLFYPAFVHISLIFMLVGLFAQKIPRRIRDYILAALLIAYAMFNSGNSASVCKAIAVVILIISSKIFSSGSILNAIALYVIAALLINPMLLYSSGFVLSAVSAVFLNYMLPSFKARNRIKSRFFAIIIIQASVTPLIGFFFGNVGIYSLLVSCVFMPILSFIIVLSPFMFIGFAFKVTIPAGWIIHKLILVLLHIPILVNALPFSKIAIPKPSAAFILAFYIAAAALWYFKKHSIEKAHICAAISAGLAFSCAAVFFTDADKLRLDFVDVGQGDAALIHMPFSGNILIDGGGSPAYSKYNVGQSIFVPYLTSHGVNVVQAAFVSHCHKDHAQGIVEAIKAIKVHNLFIPSIDEESEWKEALEEAAQKNGTKIWYVEKPIRVNMDDISLYVYPPLNDTAENSNDTSMMINLCYGEFNCLFTGDMTESGEKSMLTAGNVHEAEVLKVAHHGSLTSTSEEFVNAVKPEISLIGCGENNSYGFPREEILERLKGTTILRTDKDGSITILADKEANIKIKTKK